MAKILEMSANVTVPVMSQLSNKKATKPNQANTKDSSNGR